MVVKDLSRLGRNYLEAGDYIEKIFPFIGVRFIAVTDNYDSLTELCQTYSVDINQINKTLLAIDYVYDKSVNQFV